MTNGEKLRQQRIVKVCAQYAEKLQYSKEILSTLFPLTQARFENLTIAQDGDIEACISRFCKLQDYIGAKLLPILIDTFAPPSLEPRTYIDQLNLLEKLNVISSRNDWDALRNVRNNLAHDYPEEEDHVKQLNAAYAAIDPLLAFWAYIKKHLPKELLMLTE